MVRISRFAAALTAGPATVALATAAHQHHPRVPSLDVPACPRRATVSYDRSVPDGAPFPRTDVSLCYDDTALHIAFLAAGETNFYYNASYGTNDPIWQYEVMETFIARSYDAAAATDPQTYLEFEVAPNNVTFQAFIYNPSKVRAAGAPFDTAFVVEPLVDGLVAQTTLDRKGHTWVSDVRVPLGLFNVDAGKARGTAWRMNFFRTVVAPDTFPDQLLGAWSRPDQASFHMTPYFGRVFFT